MSEGEMGWDFGVNRCNPLYIGSINKVLLYNTGSYSQYPVRNHSGKEDFKRMYKYTFLYVYVICMYMDN